MKLKVKLLLALSTFSQDIIAFHFTKLSHQKLPKLRLLAAVESKSRTVTIEDTRFEEKKQTLKDIIENQDITIKDLETLINSKIAVQKPPTFSLSPIGNYLDSLNYSNGDVAKPFLANGSSTTHSNFIGSQSLLEKPPAKISSNTLKNVPSQPKQNEISSFSFSSTSSVSSTVALDSTKVRQDSIALAESLRQKEKMSYITKLIENLDVTAQDLKLLANELNGVQSAPVEEKHEELSRSTPLTDEKIMLDGVSNNKNSVTAISEGIPSITTKVTRKVSSFQPISQPLASVTPIGTFSDSSKHPLGMQNGLFKDKFSKNKQIIKSQEISMTNIETSMNNQVMKDEKASNEVITESESVVEKLDSLPLSHSMERRENVITEEVSTAKLSAEASVKLGEKDSDPIPTPIFPISQSTGTQTNTIGLDSDIKVTISLPSPGKEISLQSENVNDKQPEAKMEAEFKEKITDLKMVIKSQDEVRSKLNSLIDQYLPAQEVKETISESKHKSSQTTNSVEVESLETSKINTISLTALKGIDSSIQADYEQSNEVESNSSKQLEPTLSISEPVLLPKITTAQETKQTEMTVDTTEEPTLQPRGDATPLSKSTAIAPQQKDTAKGGIVGEIFRINALNLAILLTVAFIVFLDTQTQIFSPYF